MDKQIHTVTSPVMGTVYRSSAPDSPTWWNPASPSNPKTLSA